MKNKGIMKINVCKRLMFAVCFAAGVAVYGQDATGHVNPFLSEFNTPYGVPPRVPERDGRAETGNRCHSKPALDARFRKYHCGTRS